MSCNGKSPKAFKFYLYGVCNGIKKAPGYTSKFLLVLKTHLYLRYTHVNLVETILHSQKILLLNEQTTTWQR